MLRRTAARERPVTVVPVAFRWLLALSLAAQLLWSALQPPPVARAEDLSPPLSAPGLRLLALGDRVVAAQLLMLWLQTQDNQPGISIPFAALDYGRVIGWLRNALALDPRTQYPLLAASRLYAEIPVPEKQRAMLDFVHEEFSADPNRRWPWLAQAAYIAKHRLHDMPLALEYARALAQGVTDPQVPSWVTQMHILLLADLGEVETAKVLLGGLLESGKLKDPNEYRFLSGRLRELEEHGSDATAPPEGQGDHAR